MLAISTHATSNQGHRKEFHQCMHLPAPPDMHAAATRLAPRWPCSLDTPPDPFEDLAVCRCVEDKRSQERSCTGAAATTCSATGMRLLHELCSESERCRNGNMTGGVGACECECVALMLFRARHWRCKYFQGWPCGHAQQSETRESDGWLGTSDRCSESERVVPDSHARTSGGKYSAE
ncbi:hypothetical protein CONLIGDRAFT_222566 [Coniochaeta ligniaria NRRL 30616]|uniref:Uncharacterized protein n=1 Tax=Coniochaeta ligniaria NRRL 30616 TaxID=1408157 RepID=A0A1J7I4N7_9PEZI|nr:hypothetical protein CONLIGDRAFT_222566 [Coniochaeta ligniaria NRRL 30616]